MSYYCKRCKTLVSHGGMHDCMPSESPVRSCALVRTETLEDGTRILFIEESETTRYVPYIHGETGSLNLAIVDKRSGQVVSTSLKNLKVIFNRLGTCALS